MKKYLKPLYATAETYRKVKIHCAITGRVLGSFVTEALEAALKKAQSKESK